LLVFISWLKLHGANQLIFYANDVTVLDGSVHTMDIQRNTETLAVASKETSLEVNAEKSKYVIMSGGQNARQNHNIKTDNSSFDGVQQFQYWGRTQTNQNSIQKHSADWSQGLLTIIRWRILCLPICYPKV